MSVFYTAIQYALGALLVAPFALALFAAVAFAVTGLFNAIKELTLNFLRLSFMLLETKGC